MGYRMERIQGHSRTAYVLYTERMGYLATLSWYRGKLVYDTHMPEMAGIPAKEFEMTARKLDNGESPNV